MTAKTSREYAATMHDDDRDELDDLIAERSSDPQFLAALVDAENRSKIVFQLVDLRKTMKITQQVVAERMGTTQSAISDFENGGTDYFASTAQRYARAVTGRVKLLVDMPCDGPWASTSGRYVSHRASVKQAAPATTRTTREWRDVAVRA